MDDGGAGNPSEQGQFDEGRPHRPSHAKSQYASAEEKKLVVKSFMDILASKIDDRVLRAPLGTERDILLAPIVHPGLYLGAAVGIAQFLFMRKAPVYIFGRMRSRQGLDPTFREGAVMRAAGTAFDGALSAATGCAVWAYNVDEQGVYAAAAGIPLIEGRSAVSDALCDDFVALHRRVGDRFWEEQGGTDGSVASLRRFVENCRRRRAHEDAVRTERGIGRDEPVSIPRGGVSSVYDAAEDEWAGSDRFRDELSYTDES